MLPGSTKIISYLPKGGLILQGWGRLTLPPWHPPSLHYLTQVWTMLLCVSQLPLACLILSITFSFLTDVTGPNACRGQVGDIKERSWANGDINKRKEVRILTKDDFHCSAPADCCTVRCWVQGFIQFFFLITHLKMNIFKNCISRT